MLNQVAARLRKFLGRARKGHGVHAPFHVTTYRGHTVQTFQSLELAIELARKIFGARSLRSRPARFTDLEPAKKIAA